MCILPLYNASLESRWQKITRLPAAPVFDSRNAPLFHPALPPTLHSPRSQARQESFEWKSIFPFDGSTDSEEMQLKHPLSENLVGLTIPSPPQGIGTGAPEKGKIKKRENKKRKQSERKIFIRLKLI